LATVHRAETTDDKELLQGVLQAFAELPWPVVIPLHPRTRSRIEEFSLESWLSREGIYVIEPVGYREMITLERHAQAVLTDSGGVQREACHLGVPTYILRNETEWTELVVRGQAVLTGVRYEDIIAAIGQGHWDPGPRPEDLDPVNCIIKDLQRGN
jgi:UDP-N-acetylglucosamine 2-epimerase